MKFAYTVAIALALSGSAVAHASAPPVLSVALFDFESREETVRDLGPKLALLINVRLSAETNLAMVERAELEKVLGEQELGLSGVVQADGAAKVSQLTGAKVIITGR